ncbi:MAG: BON domain-containing protein [Desulfovibrionaceae bacterium]|nr:BON domain-containing protein [Desulfovibrionaceae bacterium]
MKGLIFAGILVASFLLMPAQPAHAGVISDKIAQAENFATDSAITTELKARYLAEKELDSLDIKVETVQGVVTLRGQVQKESQAAAAVKIARGTKGVAKVVNKISVMP